MVLLLPGSKQQIINVKISKMIKNLSNAFIKLYIY